MEKLILNTDTLTISYTDTNFEIPFFNVLGEEDILSHINLPISLEGEKFFSLRVLSAFLKKYGVFQFLFPSVRDFLIVIDNIKPKLYLVGEKDNVIDLNSKRKNTESAKLFKCLLLEKRNTITKRISEKQEVLSLNIYKNTLLMGSEIMSEEIHADVNSVYTLSGIAIEHYLDIPIYMCKTSNSLHETIVCESGKERDSVYTYCDMEEKITLYEMLEGILYSITLYPESFMFDDDMEEKITDSMNVVKFNDPEKEDE